MDVVSYGIEVTNLTVKRRRFDGFDLIVLPQIGIRPMYWRQSPIPEFHRYSVFTLQWYVVGWSALFGKE